MSLFALAMNPNLTEEQFMELSRNEIANRERLANTLFACAEKMKVEHGPDAALHYVTQCLPMLTMF